MFVLIFFSLVALSQSSLFWGVKLFLAGCCLLLGMNTYQNKKPYPKLHAIQYAQQHWTFLLKNTDESSGDNIKVSCETMHDEVLYSEIKILIHNMLFQLIQFSNSDKKKIFILFNDQLDARELRLLHLASIKKSLYSNR